MAYKSIARLTVDSMSNNDRTTQLRATSTDTPRIPVTTGVANAFKADEIRRIDRGEYRLTRQESAPNEGVVDWLLSCPVKGYFVPIESESTDTL